LDGDPDGFQGDRVARHEQRVRGGVVGGGPGTGTRGAIAAFGGGAKAGVGCQRKSPSGLMSVARNI
jgi:hypothetical protein